MQKVWIEPSENWVPEIVFDEDHSRWAGTPRCLHWVYKKGRQCLKPPMKGKSKKPHPAGDGWKQKCMSHGGKARSGMAHPQFKTGRYGMDLGDKKAKALDRLLTDEDLLKLDDNIALLDLRIVDLVTSLTEGGNPAQMWKQAFKYWDLMWRATAREDSDAVAKHRNELDGILRTGIREIATWDEIQDRSEARRKLTDSEVRRREKMRYLVMVEDTLRDYMMMGREIKLAVLDADIPKEIKVQMLKRIQSGFARHMQISIAQGTESDSD